MSTTPEINGHTYKIGKLSAMQQFHVVRRLAGVLAGLAGLDKQGLEGLKDAPKDQVAAHLLESMPDVLPALAQGLATMDDVTAEFVIFTCLGVVERKERAGGWARVCVNGQLMFENLGMVEMLTLVANVLKENMGGFFDALGAASSGAAPTSTTKESR